MRVKRIWSRYSDTISLEERVNEFLSGLTDDQIISITVTPDITGHGLEWATIIYKEAK